VLDEADPALLDMGFILRQCEKILRCLSPAKRQNLLVSLATFPTPHPQSWPTGCCTSPATAKPPLKTGRAAWWSSDAPLRQWARQKAI